MTEMLLKETLRKVMEAGWHYFECPRTRRTDVECTCGWDQARSAARQLLDVGGLGER